MKRPDYAILEAPSVLGLKPSGVQDLSKQLLTYGLATRTAARYAGCLNTPAYNPVKDAETGVLNAHSIASWSPKLADAMGNILDRGEFPIVLGGDCSILLGTALALKRRGMYGLLFLDGHADFYQPQAEPHGEAASMDLALATGHGPPLLTNLEQRGPLVAIENAFLFSYRDGEEQRQYGSQPVPNNLRSFDLNAVRARGIEAAAIEAVAHVSRSDLDGFLIHVDVDCLDDKVMPAVDYRIADGLSWAEFKHILSAALNSGKAVGMEITIYNPKLDADGSCGQALVDNLIEVLNPS